MMVAEKLVGTSWTSFLGTGASCTNIALEASNHTISQEYVFGEISSCLPLFCCSSKALKTF